MVGSLSRSGAFGWSSSYDRQTVYRVDDVKEFNSRIGNYWIARRIQQNDLILCLSYAMDCSHEFVILEIKANFMRAILRSRFRVYSSGAVSKLGTLDERTFNKLAIGDAVPFKRTANVYEIPGFLKPKIKYPFEIQQSFG